MFYLVQLCLFSKSQLEQSSFAPPILFFLKHLLCLDDCRLGFHCLVPRLPNTGSYNVVVVWYEVSKTRCFRLYKDVLAIVESVVLSCVLDSV